MKKGKELGVDAGEMLVGKKGWRAGGLEGWRCMLGCDIYIRFAVVLCWDMHVLMLCLYMHNFSFFFLLPPFFCEEEGEAGSR